MDRTVPVNEGVFNGSQLDLLGVSVHHLGTIFLDRVLAHHDGLSRDSNIYQIEDLRKPTGLIRQLSQNVLCPITKKWGAAYVHCLKGKDHVGPATQMLSYSWGYVH